MAHVTLKSPMMRRNKPATTSRLHSSGTDLNKVFTTSLRFWATSSAVSYVPDCFWGSPQPKYERMLELPGPGP